MAKERELPPPLEMSCLNALWELGEGNVEEVRVFVSQARPLAYTTVLTLLDRLSRRGAVSRRKEGRGFRYQPSIDRDKLRRLALAQFLDNHFSGSVANLKSFLDVETVLGIMHPARTPEHSEPVPAPEPALAEPVNEAPLSMSAIAGSDSNA